MSEKYQMLRVSFARGRTRPLRQKLVSLGFISFGALLASACGDDPAEGPSPHDQVAAILGAGPEGKGSCSISTCHGDGTASAGLNLKSSADLTQLLVNKPACEAPMFDLVEPGKPEESWLYLKLTAPVMAKNELVEDPAWGDPGEDCEEAAGFGKRMPETGSPLSEAQVAQIRDWILAGAPGP